MTRSRGALRVPLDPGVGGLCPQLPPRRLENPSPKLSTKSGQLQNLIDLSVEPTTGIEPVTC